MVLRIALWGSFALLTFCTLLQAIAALSSLPPWAKSRKNMFVIAIILVILSVGMGYVSLVSSYDVSSDGPKQTATATTSSPTTNATSTANGVVTATAAVTQLASSSGTPINNQKNPRLPLTLECVQCDYGIINIVLQSITYYSTSGNYELAFFITNKTGMRCSNVFFTNLYLALPNNTQDQPIQAMPHWPMAVNETVEQDAFFASLQPGTRYNLNIGINYCYNNEYAINTYETYDFYF